LSDRVSGEYKPVLWVQKKNKTRNTPDQIPDKELDFLFNPGPQRGIQQFENMIRKDPAATCKNAESRMSGQVRGAYAN
jgi:hypothetical protein